MKHKKESLLSGSQFVFHRQSGERGETKMEQTSPLKRLVQRTAL